MSDFPKESAFKQATEIAGQLKMIESEEDINTFIQRAERVAASFEIDLEQIVVWLNEAIYMIDNPQARRLIEDARDEAQRGLR